MNLLWKDATLSQASSPSPMYNIAECSNPTSVPVVKKENVLASCAAFLIHQKRVTWECVLHETVKDIGLSLIQSIQSIKLLESLESR